MILNSNKLFLSNKKFSEYLLVNLIDDSFLGFSSLQSVYWQYLRSYYRLKPFRVIVLAAITVLLKNLLINDFKTETVWINLKKMIRDIRTIIYFIDKNN